MSSPHVRSDPGEEPSNATAAGELPASLAEKASGLDLVDPLAARPTGQRSIAVVPKLCVSVFQQICSEQRLGCAEVSSKQ